MTSIKVKFRASTVAQREGTIYFQVIKNRKVKQIATRHKIFSYEWDNTNSRIITSGKNNKRREQLSAMQRTLTLEYESLLREISLHTNDLSLSFEQITTTHHNQSLNGYLFPFMKRCIEQLTRQCRTKTASTYATTLRSFAQFRQQEDILLDHIDGFIMKRYENWLKWRNITPNTISFYMRILRAVYNQAVNFGITEQKLPFRTVYTGIDKTVKRAVRADVITRLRALNLQAHPHLQFARDMFLFSFYTRGMAFVDMAHLSKNSIHEGHLCYYRKKTGQHLRIKVEPCIAQIISQYAHLTTHSPQLLPIISDRLQYESALRVQNSRLQTISTMLGLHQPLTSYVARHSWASIAKHSGVSLEIISQGMGHNNENTTRIYLASLDQTIIDNANAMLLAHI